MQVGKGHADFSGKEQQDANEFYTHLTTLMDRCHRTPGEFNPADCLMFTVEERWECGSSGKVRYVTREDDDARRCLFTNLYEPTGD